MSRTQQAIDLVLHHGFSKAEAARKIGITPEAVAEPMRKMGLGGYTDAGRRAQAARRGQPMRPEVLAQHRVRMVQIGQRYRDAMGIDVDQVVDLHFRDGKSYGQIASILNMTRCQVAGYIHRYRRGAALIGVKEIV